MNARNSQENVLFEQTGRIPLDHSRSEASSNSLLVSGSGRPSGPSLRALGGLIRAGRVDRPPVPPLTTAVSADTADARRRRVPGKEEEVLSPSDDDSLLDSSFFSKPNLIYLLVERMSANVGNLPSPGEFKSIKSPSGSRLISMCTAALSMEDT